MRRSKLLLAGAAVLGAAIAAVAIAFAVRDAGSGRLQTTAWAGAVCTSLSEWRSSITALADVSGGTLTKESLREKLAAAEDATAKLTADLRALGPPDLEAGDEVKRELDASVTALESTYAELRAGAQDALDAEDPASFLRSLARLAPTFQRLLDQIAGTVETLQNADVAAEARAELERAFAEAEPCRALTAEG